MGVLMMNIIYWIIQLEINLLPVYYLQINFFQLGGTDRNFNLIWS